MNRAVLLPLLLAAPALASQPAPDPHQVRIAISSITLGRDCQAAAAQKADHAQGDTADGQSAKTMRACQQSSVQLAISGADVGTPVVLRVGEIQIFDDQGTSLGKLVARTPTRFVDGIYSAWDETIPLKSTLSVSYKLGDSPVTLQRGVSYRVQLRVTVGKQDRTVEKSIRLDAPAYLPPDVQT